MNEFDVIKSPIEETNLIEASAGTGKTYAISIIFLRLIVEKNFGIEDILVVTFTIPATMELRLRIRERLKDAVNVIEGIEIGDKSVTLLMKQYIGNAVMKQRVLTAVKNFDQASVYTIHSFCRQMLIDNAFESGSLFTSEIVNDDELVELGVIDFCRTELYNSSPAFVSFFMDNCSPDELVKLYRKRPLSDDLRIEPDTQGADIKHLESSYKIIFSLYSKLSDAWKRCKTEVVEIIFRENFLKGNIYKDESKDALVESMDEYVAGENPFAIFDKFQNYTSDKIRNSLLKGREYQESEVFDICQELYNEYDNYYEKGRSILVQVKKRLFEKIDNIIREKRNVKCSRSFDDLIKDAKNGLDSPSGKLLAAKVASRYRAALIDEFQDTDDLQFYIFNRLFNNENTILFLIGDPKQAIYRFRGADIFSYLRAADHVKNRYSLASNWRSRRELIACINSVFEKCTNPFVFERIEFHPVRPGDDNQGEILLKSGKPATPLDIWLADDNPDAGRDLMEQLAAEISLMINRGRDNPYKLGEKSINPGNIAVLVRTGRQAAEVRDSFSRYSIPSVSRGMDNVLNTEEARSLYFISAAIAEPSVSALVRAAASTDVMGGNAESLFCFIKHSEDTDELDTLASRFYTYREIWINGGFLSMITAFMEGESVPSRLFSFKGGERMIANINQMAEILQQEEHERGLIPKELVGWFANTIASPPDDDKYSMRLERDDDAVNIITMHACKGLEFPIVYCPFLGRSGDNSDNYIIYHDEKEEYRPVIYIDKNVPEDVRNTRKKEDLAENVRLLYVALTRARSACRVMFAPNKLFTGSAAYHIFVKDSGYATGKDRENLVKALSALSSDSDGKISFTRGVVLQGKQYISEQYPADVIAAREFSGDVKGVWKTHSYSAIAAGASSAMSEVSDEKDFQSEYHARKGKGTGIFGFETGARAGLCIHEVFEKSDFTVKGREDVDDICGMVLDKYRFDVSSKVHISDMFFNVVNCTLDENSGLKLSGINSISRLSELEFNFPVESFDSGRFREIFRGGGGYCDKIYRNLADNRSEPGGMMKGFIDLVFQHSNKFYIADWKSNHLGNSYAEYSQEQIGAEMERHNYFLQYYIYTVALNRYLKLRLPGYSYEEQFGGVYYFFVRGMNPDSPGSTGIFRDKPEIGVINKMDAYFNGVI